MSDQNILESEIKLLLNHYNANNFAFVIQKSLKLLMFPLGKSIKRENLHQNIF